MKHFLDRSSIMTSFYDLKCDAFTNFGPRFTKKLFNWLILHLSSFVHHFNHLFNRVQWISALWCLFFLIFFFLYQRFCTNFNGYKYFWVSLYSLFSTILSKFTRMSWFIFPPYFLNYFYLYFFCFCWLKTSGNLL